MRRETGLSQMLKRSWVACVLVCAVLCAQHSNAIRVRGGLKFVDFEPEMMGQPLEKPDLNLTPAPPMTDPPLSVETAPRFKAQSQEVVRALNNLDLKSMTNSTGPAPRQAFPRPVVAAYGTMAAETVQRANYALAMLRSQREGLESFLKIQRHDIDLWVANQKKIAEGQIQQQIQTVGRLEDEVSHLQRVYQDAVAKERSYQVQKQMLIAERQLQRTPPVMPVEVAVALTDSQYKEALEKLNKYISAAHEVIAQTHAHIMARKNMADQLNTWIKHSNQTLHEWLHLQGGLLARRISQTEKALAVNSARIQAVSKMAGEASAAFKEYSTCIVRLDIKTRMAELKAAKKKWTETKPKTPYDEAVIKSYVVALDLELKAFKKRLAKENPGDEKVTPPPTVWGVLSGFPSGPKVVFPEPVKTKLHPWVPPHHTVWVHPPGYKDPLPPPTDPIVRYHVPTEQEHRNLNTWISPTLPSDLGQSVTAGTDAFGRHTWFPGALAAVTSDPAMATAAQGAASAVGSAPAPTEKNNGAVLPFGVGVPFPALALPSLPSFVEQSVTVKPHNGLQLPKGVPTLPDLPPPPNADLIL